MTTDADLEHHVMERPRIPTARRKPSMKRMDMETNTLVDVEMNQENKSSTKQLDPINLSNKFFVAPRLPKKEVDCEDENHIQQPTAQQQQLNELVLSNRKSISQYQTQPQLTIQQQINERVLSTRKLTPVKLQSQQQSTLSQQQANKERALSSRKSSQNSNQQQDTNKDQALSNRKWAQVLGCPMNENQLLQEQSKVKRMAKVKGARQKDIDFMLEQIKTVQHIEMIQQQSNKPLDYIQRRFLRQSTTTTTTTAARSFSFQRRRTTTNLRDKKISLALN